MKVEIQALVVHAQGAPTVVVATPIGTAELVLGSRAPVAVGERCDAELTLEARLQRGVNLWPAEVGTPRLVSEGEVTTLVGVVEAVEDDGVVILRLARDLLVMIDADPGEVAAGEWVRVALPLRAVSVFLGAPAAGDRPGGPRDAE